MGNLQTYTVMLFLDHIHFICLFYGMIDVYGYKIQSQIDSVKGEIYVAFNASHLPVIISLPERPGYRWEPLVDTSKPVPFDFLSSDLPAKEIAIKQYAPFLDANLYPMLSYSSIILLQLPDENA